MNKEIGRVLLGSLLTILFNKFWRGGGLVFSIILMVVGLGLFSLGISSYKHSLYVRTHYQASDCTIAQHVPDSRAAGLEKGTSPSNHLYCPEAIVRFAAQNQMYDVNIRLSCAEGKSGENNILSQYPIGQVRPCWFDPYNLSQVIFTRNDSTGFQIFLMGAGIFLIFYTVYRGFFLDSKKNIPTTDSAELQDIPPQLSANPTESSEKLSEVSENPDELSSPAIQPSPSTQPPIPAELKPSLLGEKIAELLENANIAKIQKTEELSEIKNPYLRLGIPLLAALVMGFFAFFIIKQELAVNTKFIETRCNIMEKKLEVRNAFSKDDKTTYRPTFYVNYNVDNRTYSRWSFVDILAATSSNKSSNEAKLDQYQTGQSYACWYNPEDPSVVVLERGYSWLGIILGVASLLILIFAPFVKIYGRN